MLFTWGHTSDDCEVRFELGCGPHPKPLSLWETGDRNIISGQTHLRIVVERLHVRCCLAICYAGGALGIAVMVGTSSMTWLLAFATIYGMIRGAQPFVSSLAWSNYFG